MTKVVGVRFSDTGKTYYFDPKGLDIKTEMKLSLKLQTVLNLARHLAV